MKYKVGDKVIIRRWKEMEKEFGPVASEPGDNFLRNNRSSSVFTEGMEEKLKRDHPNRILTIEKVYGTGYKMEEFEDRWSWEEWMIKHEYLKAYLIHDPIETRFEILDL